MDFAEKLKMIRMDRGYTTQSVATYVGLSHGNYVDLETGATSLNQISNEKLDRIADFLNVTVSYLKENRTNPNPGLTISPTPKEPSKALFPAAHQFLDSAAKHLKDRASQRDCPDGEKSMARTVASFNAMYGTTITTEQGWMFMVFLKASRAKNGKYVQDDYEDGAAYFALAGECAAKAESLDI